MYYNSTTFWFFSFEHCTLYYSQFKFQVFPLKHPIHKCCWKINPTNFLKVNVSLTWREIAEIPFQEFKSRYLIHFKWSRTLGYPHFSSVQTENYSVKTDSIEMFTLTIIMPRLEHKVLPYCGKIQFAKWMEQKKGSTLIYDTYMLTLFEVCLFKCSRHIFQVCRGDSPIKFLFGS